MTSLSAATGLRPPDRNAGDGEETDGGQSADAVQKSLAENVEDDSQSEEEEAAAPIKRPRNPSDPTPQEREEHYATHRPFRSWRPVCVKARGKEDPHYKKTKEDKEGGLPRVCFDYATIRADTGTGAKTMIIGRDDWTKMTFAYPVTCKGLGDQHVVQRVMKAMDETGQTRMILKGDGEPSLVQVQEAVKATRGQETLLQNPPAYDPQANGSAERAVQEVKAQLRTIKLGLEARVGREVHQEMAVMDWMILHSSGTINRFLKGPDSRTPYYRTYGREFNATVLDSENRFGQNPKEASRT